MGAAAAANVTDSEQQTEETTRPKGRWSFRWWFILSATGILLLLFGAFLFYTANCCTYTTRAKVSEGLNLSGGAKVAVAEFRRDNGRFPENNREAGIADAINGKFVSAVQVQSDGRIVVIYGGDSPNKNIAGKTLVLRAAVSADGAITWTCSSEDIDDRDLPAVCR